MGTVTTAVVGEDGADRDAERAVVVDSREQEGDRGRMALVAKDTRKRQARVIVNRDMDEFPPDTTRVSPTVAVDAMTNAADAAEFLDVQVKQRAGTVVLIASRGSGRIDCA